MRYSFLNSNFPAEILANLKRDQNKKAINPTHWSMLDQPTKFGLDDIIFKIFMVPFKGNEMIFSQIQKVKCIFCLEIIDLSDLDCSIARNHMETFHKNAGAWNALILDEIEASGAKMNNNIKFEDSETESESETDCLHYNLQMKRKKISN